MKHLPVVPNSRVVVVQFVVGSRHAPPAARVVVWWHPSPACRRCERSVVSLVWVCALRKAQASIVASTHRRCLDVDIAGAKGNEMKIAKEKKMSGVNRQGSQLINRGSRPVRSDLVTTHIRLAIVNLNV
jgi:hypothetical protein